MDYFNFVISRLTFDDLNVLGVLLDSDATATFKAMKKSDVQEKSKMSQAHYRKTIYRLIAIGFIEIIAGVKEHKVFITNYGTMALEKSLEGMVG